MNARKVLLASGTAVVLLLAGAAFIVRNSRPAPRRPAAATPAARPAPGAASSLEAAPPAAIPEEAAVPEAPSAAPIPPPVDLAAADRDLDLFGVAVDTSGQPVAGARVEALSSAAPRGIFIDGAAHEETRAGHVSRTARDGTFSLRLERGDEVDLRISHPGFATADLPGRLAGELVQVVLHPPAALEVAVVDAEGRPVSEVEVHLWRHDAGRPGEPVYGQRREVTGAGGRLRFTHLEPGMASLSLTPADAGSPSWQAIEIPSGETLAVEAVLPAARSIGGRVTDAATGKPIARARVQTDPTPGRAVLTDAGGRYLLTRWRGAPDARLGVEAEGYGRQEKAVPPRGAVDFALEAAIRAAGRVAGAGGEPLPGARVTAVARRKQGDAAGLENPSAVTDAHGRFLVALVPTDSPHTLVLEAEGHGRSFLDVGGESAAEGFVDLGTITLPEARRLEGIALDGDRNPLSDAGVRLECEDGPGAASRRTDDLGRFRFPGLSAGRYRLTLQVSGLPRTVQSVDLPGDRDILDLELTAPAGRSLSLLVLDTAGDPVPGVPLQLCPQAASRAASGRTGADGRALFRGLEASPVRIYAFPGRGFLLPPEPRLETPAGQEVVLRLETAASIAGTLLSSKRHPLAGLEVAAVSRLDGEELGVAFSDGQGRFELRLPPRSPVDLVVTGRRSGAAAGETAREEWTFRGNLRAVAAPADGVQLRADRVALARRLSVRVDDPDGNPVPGAVVVLRARGLEPAGRKLTTGGDGRAHFQRLAPETLAVEARGMPLGSPAGLDESRILWPEPTEVFPDGQELVISLGRR